jgi:hypothetical protein
MVDECSKYLLMNDQKSEKAHLPTRDFMVNYEESTTELIEVVSETQEVVNDTHVLSLETKVADKEASAEVIEVLSQTQEWVEQEASSEKESKKESLSYNANQPKSEGEKVTVSPKPITESKTKDTPRTAEVHKRLTLLDTGSHAKLIQKRENYRQEHEEKSRKRQSVQGKRMTEAFARTRNIECGTLVNLTVIVRDRSNCNPLGITAVVFLVNTNGGFCAVCENGILGSQGQKHWFNFGDYSVLDPNVTITNKLADIRRLIQNGTFDEKTFNLIGMHKAHLIMVGHVPNGRQKCSCKGGLCSKRCGFCKSNRTCTSRCSCSGMFKPEQNS